MWMAFPMLITGSTPSRLGGSICSTRIGATAGIGPEGGALAGGCGGPLACSAATLVFKALAGRLASVTAVAAASADGAFSAFMSSADSVLLFFINRIMSNLSRSSAEGTPASLATSSAVNSPWLTIKRKSGSGAGMPVAGAALAGVAASLLVLAVLALLLELLSDAKANTGRSNSARTPAQIRSEVRIMIEASCLVNSVLSRSWQSLTGIAKTQTATSVPERTECGHQAGF